MDNEYICDSNSAIKIKLVRRKRDIVDDVGFSPAMTHQIFGPRQEIFGYRGLEIKLYYAACSLKPYLGHSFEEQLVDKDKTFESPTSKIERLLPPDTYSDLTGFSECISEEHKFKPYGIKMEDRNMTNGRSFQINMCSVSDPGFKEFHDKLQVFLLWYVDAASFIDISDERWKFFLLYENYSDTCGNECHAIVGYLTVYEFYAYPLHKRPRISQVLILPPFQKMGLCSWALQKVYKHYRSQNNIRDITVEDPSEAFQRIRDYVDCQDSSEVFQSTENQKDIIKFMQDNLKLYPAQARRVYEILKLRSIDIRNEVEFTHFKNGIIDRLSQPFQKELHSFEKRCRLIKRNLQSLPKASAAVQKKQIEDKLESLLESYLHVIDRLRTTNQHAADNLIKDDNTSAESKAANTDKSPSNEID